MKANSDRFDAINKAAKATARRNVTEVMTLGAGIEHESIAADALNKRVLALSIDLAAKFTNVNVNDIGLR